MRTHSLITFQHPRAIYLDSLSTHSKMTGIRTVYSSEWPLRSTFQPTRHWHPIPLEPQPQISSVRCLLLQTNKHTHIHNQMCGRRLKHVHPDRKTGWTQVLSLYTHNIINIFQTLPQETDNMLQSNGAVATENSHHKMDGNWTANSPTCFGGMTNYHIGQHRTTLDGWRRDTVDFTSLTWHRDVKHLPTTTATLKTANTSSQ